MQEPEPPVNELRIVRATRLIHTARSKSVADARAIRANQTHHVATPAWLLRNRLLVDLVIAGRVSHEPPEGGRPDLGRNPQLNERFSDLGDVHGELTSTRSVLEGS